MGIRALFDAFEAKLTETLGGLQETLPAIKLSANAISEQNSAPRIVMVPTTGTISDSIGQAGFGDGVAEPRALKARKLRLEFRIWGADFGECEALMSHTAAAIHDLGWGGDSAVSEDWTKGQAATSKSGLLVVMAIVVELPLVREMPRQALVLDFPMSTEIEATT